MIRLLQLCCLVVSFQYIACKRFPSSSSDLDVVGKFTSEVSERSSRSTVYLAKVYAMKADSSSNSSSQLLSKLRLGGACTAVYIHPGAILSAWHCLDDLVGAEGVKQGYVFFRYNMAVNGKVQFHASMRTCLLKLASQASSISFLGSGLGSGIQVKTFGQGIEDIREECEDYMLAPLLKVERIGKYEVDLGLAFFDKSYVQDDFAALEDSRRPLPAVLSDVLITEGAAAVVEGYGNVGSYYYQKYQTTQPHLRRAHVVVYPYSELSTIDKDYYEYLENRRKELLAFEEEEGALAYKVMLSKSPLYYHTQFFHHMGFVKAPKAYSELLQNFCSGDSGAPIYEDYGKFRLLAIHSTGRKTRGLVDDLQYMRQAGHKDGLPVFRIPQCSDMSAVMFVAPYASEIEKAIRRHERHGY